MKGSVITLVVLGCAFAATDAVYANKVNSLPANTRENQAAALTNQPVRTPRNTRKPIYQIEKLNEISNSIPSARSRTPATVNPLDVFKDPGTTLRRLSEQQNNRRQTPIDPLEFFKVPPLDGGVSVPVGHF